MSTQSEQNCSSTRGLGNQLTPLGTSDNKWCRVDIPREFHSWDCTMRTELPPKGISAWRQSLPCLLELLADKQLRLKPTNASPIVILILYYLSLSPTGLHTTPGRGRETEKAFSCQKSHFLAPGHDFGICSVAEVEVVVFYFISIPPPFPPNEVSPKVAYITHLSSFFASQQPCEVG